MTLLFMQYIHEGQSNFLVLLGIAGIIYGINMGRMADEELDNEAHEKAIASFGIDFI